MRTRGLALLLCILMALMPVFTGFAEDGGDLLTAGGENGAGGEEGLEPPQEPDEPGEEEPAGEPEEGLTAKLFAETGGFISITDDEENKAAFVELKRATGAESPSKTLTLAWHGAGEVRDFKEFAVVCGDNAVVTVDAQAVGDGESFAVTATGNGATTVTITAVNAGGTILQNDVGADIEAVIPVEVTWPAEGFSVFPASPIPALRVGEASAVLTVLPEPAGQTTDLVSDLALLVEGADGAIDAKIIDAAAGEITVTAVHSAEAPVQFTVVSSRAGTGADIVVMKIDEGVKEIRLSETARKMLVGGEPFTISAACLPETATNTPEIRWHSDNVEVATVAGGVVSPVSAGEARVFAYIGESYEDAEVVSAAACEVRVYNSINNMEIRVKDGSTTAIIEKMILVGDEIQLEVATINGRIPANEPGCEPYHWFASDETAVTVDVTGKVTATVPGNTTVWAVTEISGNWSDNYIFITVTEPATKIRFAPEKMEINIGDSFTPVKGTSSVSRYYVQPMSAQNNELIWDTDKSAVLTVNAATGSVVGTGVGTAKLLVKDAFRATDSTVGELEVTVGKWAMVKEATASFIKREWAAISTPGSEALLKMDFFDIPWEPTWTDKLTCSSSDPGVATVSTEGDDKGKIILHGPGKVKLRVTLTHQTDFGDPRLFECDVLIWETVTKIELLEHDVLSWLAWDVDTSAPYTRMEDLSRFVVFTPEGKIGNLVWEADPNPYFHITSEGQLTMFERTGSVSMQVRAYVGTSFSTAEPDLKATLDVIIKQTSPLKLNMPTGKNPAALTKGDSFSLTPSWLLLTGMHDEDAVPDAIELRWYSSNPNVIKVNKKTGVVTVMKEGAFGKEGATIYACMENLDEGKSIRGEIELKSVVDASAIRINNGKDLVLVSKKLPMMVSIALAPANAYREGYLHFDFEPNPAVVGGVYDSAVKKLTIINFGETGITMIRAWWGDSESTYTSATIKTEIKVTVRDPAADVTLAAKPFGITGLSVLKLDKDTVGATLTAILGDDTVKWATSNKKLVKLEEDSTDFTGKTMKLVLGPGQVGTSVVTVTTGSGKKANCTVQVVENPVMVPRDVSLTPKSMKLSVGNQGEFVPNFIPKGAYTALSWDTDDHTIATVDGNGVVTGEGDGVTKVVATTIMSNGVSKTVKCNVVVSSKTEVLTLSETSIIMVTGGVAKIKVDDIVPALSDGDTFDWKSNNAAVQLSEVPGHPEQRLIKSISKKAMRATITVSTKRGNDVMKRAICRVQVFVPTKAVALNRTSVRVAYGKSTKLTATRLPDRESTEPIIWEVTSGQYAVTSNGKGTVKVMRDLGLASYARVEAFTALGAASEACLVYFFHPVKKISIDVDRSKKLTISAGRHVQVLLEATPPQMLADLSADQISWASSKPEWVVVDKYGYVTGLPTAANHINKKVTITARTESGKQASLTLTIVP